MDRAIAPLVSKRNDTEKNQCDTGMDYRFGIHNKRSSLGSSSRRSEDSDVAPYIGTDTGVSLTSHFSRMILS